MTGGATLTDKELNELTNEQLVRMLISIAGKDHEYCGYDKVLEQLRDETIRRMKSP